MDCAHAQGLAAYLFRTAICKTSASQTHRCIAQCQQVTRSNSIFSSALSSQQLHQMASQDPPTTASTSSGVLVAPGPSGITAVTGSSRDPALLEALRAAVQREIRAALPQVASASTPSDSTGTPAAFITVGQTSNVATSGELRAQGWY